MFAKSKVVFPIFSVFLGSCARTPPPADPTVEAQASAPEPTPRTARAVEDRGTIQVSRTIQEACGLSDSEAYFEYDSAALLSSDSRLLDRLATCFISGPLAGEHMSLVGRADPRGDEEYNFALGGRRSNSVKDHLVRQGVNSDNIGATSRGELDAIGNNEAEWQQDRRVDVKLASEL